MGLSVDIGVQIFNPTTGGAPSLVLWDTLADLDSYEQAISARFGFESMRTSLVVPLDEALDWLTNGLMRHAIVYSPDAEVCWEGYLHTIEAELGQERRSVSLDGMANRVKVRYTSTTGSPAATATASDTASQARYGVKDAVIGLGAISATAATNARAAYLAAHKNPVMRFGSSAGSGGMGTCRLSLSFAGWYDTLKWVLTSRASTTSTSTTTQVGDLIQTTGVGIGVTNNFLSTSRARITASGISDTEFIAADTTFLAKIEKLLAQGNSSGQRLAWGVYEGRQLVVKEWTGATPDTTFAYHRFLGDDVIYDRNGGIVQPWLVRPDTMLQTDELLDLSPVATAPDTAARYYVERVTWSVGRGSSVVRLEPSNDDSTAALLARLGG